MTDPSLNVGTVISGLDQPTSMAFLGANDFLILEKASGKVKHVVNGAVAGTALDLAVNSASERGLLGIALQPDFAHTHGVYLYWTQSSTGADSTNLADVPVLGNRVDRYLWNSTTKTLTFDKNIIVLRSFQADANQPLRGNHDAGTILFGPDGKLYSSRSATRAGADSCRTSPAPRSGRDSRTTSSAGRRPTTLTSQVSSCDSTPTAVRRATTRLLDSRPNSSTSGSGWSG